MIDGAHNRAVSNKHFTIFSLSPRNFDINEELEQLKNIEPLKPHTAFANNVLPVPIIDSYKTFIYSTSLDEKEIKIDFQ